MKLIGRIEPLDTIQDRIKYLRVSNDMTIKEIGEEFFLTYEQVSSMEKCKRSIQYQDIELYSDFFDVSPNWLVTGKE